MATERSASSSGDRPTTDLCFVGVATYDGTLLASWDTGVKDVAQILSGAAAIVRDPAGSEKQSFLYRRQQIHCLKVSQLQIILVAIADESSGLAGPFSVLLRARGQVRTAYTRDDVESLMVDVSSPRTATNSRPASQTTLATGPVAGATRAQLEDMLEASVFATPGTGRFARHDKAKEVKQELDAVRTVMVQNIERVLDRGERIHLLVDRTAQLNQDAVLFSRGAGKVKRRMWYRRVKTTILIAVVLLGLIYLFIGGACGFGLQLCM